MRVRSSSMVRYSFLPSLGWMRSRASSSFIGLLRIMPCRTALLRAVENIPRYRLAVFSLIGLGLPYLIWEFGKFRKNFTYPRQNSALTSSSEMKPLFVSSRYFSMVCSISTRQWSVDFLMPTPPSQYFFIHVVRSIEPCFTVSQSCMP